LKIKEYCNPYWRFFAVEDNQKMKTEIQKEIGELAKIIGTLSEKYQGEVLLDDAQKVFLSLSVHVGKALNIQLQ